MMQTADVVIVGGAAVGSAVAHYLTSDPAFSGRVVIVERDPTYAACATALSAASIRHQFSNPVNVAMSRYGTQVLRRFKADFGLDPGFQEGGYLFLAATQSQEATLAANHAVQKGLGADVVLWSQDRLAAAFPHLATDDILVASYGRSGEGWYDPVALMTGFRQAARTRGAEVIRAEVTGLTRDHDRITHVHLSDGTAIACGWVVNAAGCRGAQVAAMAGVDIPVAPRKRTVFVFDCRESPEGTARVNGGRLPLMIDPSGVWCRPEGRLWLAGSAPDPDPDVDPEDLDPDHDQWEETVWPALAARVPAFEAVKVIRAWAGQYDMNTLDANAILGPHDEVSNFLFANGFSGHGLQQSPAVGRGLAEWIVHRRWVSLDLSPLGFDRVRAGRPFLERAVI
jgi:glycine/D-amino acid oxidase-like deaminating enzyme